MLRETDSPGVLDAHYRDRVLVARADVPVVKGVVGVTELVDDLVARPGLDDYADTAGARRSANAGNEVDAVLKPRVTCTESVTVVGVVAARGGVVELARRSGAESLPANNHRWRLGGAGEGDSADSKRRRADGSRRRTAAVAAAASAIAATASARATAAATTSSVVGSGAAAAAVRSPAANETVGEGDGFPSLECTRRAITAAAATIRVPSAVKRPGTLVRNDEDSSLAIADAPPASLALL